MNFLAHLYLAEPGGPSMIGNLLPDLVRGGAAREAGPGLDPRVAAGAARHRRVDRLTDAHPAHCRAVVRLRPRHGRFAPILADVMFDHCLARHWARWGGGTTLRRFVDGAYEAMLGAGALTPTPMRPILARMAREDWLGSYATSEGVGARFEQMAARFARRWGRSFDPAAAVDDMRADREALTESFEAVMSDLLESFEAQAQAVPNCKTPLPNAPALTPASAASSPSPATSASPGEARPCPRSPPAPPRPS